jgi:hypothetical protein
MKKIAIFLVIIFLSTPAFGFCVHDANEAACRLAYKKETLQNMADEISRRYAIKSAEKADPDHLREQSRQDQLRFQKREIDSINEELKKIK